MVDWFGRSKQANIQGLIAQKDYNGAIVQIRAQLQRRKGDERLRVRLAEVLVQAGRRDEAIGILMPLADDLALRGMAAKAISILKRVHKLRPRDPEVEEKLAYLIRQQLNPSAGPWVRREAPPERAPEPEIGMEEIEEDGGIGMEGPEEAVPAPPEAAAPPEVAAPPREAASAPPPEAAAQPDAPATEQEAPEEGEDFAFDEAFRDQLATLLEDVFTPGEDGSVEAGSGDAPIIDTPLFKDFSQDELVAVIRGLQLRIYEPGEIIVSAGEPGDSMFILTSGMVRAYMRNPSGAHVALRQMREGDFFGEMALITGNPRSATVTAASNCDLLELDRKNLLEISEKHPHVDEVLRAFYAQRAQHSARTARDQA